MPEPQPATQPDVSVVILTTGNRAAELHTAVASALAQADAGIEVLVVANGVPTDELHLPADHRVVVIASKANVGIPGGRNVGAAHASGRFVAFLDDDAHFVDGSVLARCAARFDDRASLGAIALRIVDEHGETAHRHVPRIGARHPDRSGAVASFLGGAVVMRRIAFDEAGGYPSEFVYAMEESDLSLRLIDREWVIWYDGVPAVFHPASEPARHSGAIERTMRNRVWLAHRQLPASLAAVYVANWLAISSVRRPRDVHRLLGATLGGWRTRPGSRSPIGWRTVVRLTRLGRPPII